MEAMRFQNSEVIDPDKLKDFAERFNSPRLMNAFYDRHSIIE